MSSVKVPQEKDSGKEKPSSKTSEPGPERDSEPEPSKENTASQSSSPHKDKLEKHRSSCAICQTKVFSSKKYSGASACVRSEVQTFNF